MKFLVTGGSGILGKYLVAELNKAKHQVFSPTKTQMNIGDFASVAQRFSDYQPEIVIHLAALTNVDYCQEHPEETFHINTEATKNIAELCHQHDSLLIYVSTGMVYSGEKNQPYMEQDTASPANVYGDSKWQAEQQIKNILTRFFIFSITWLFGGKQEDTKFVGKMLNLGRQNDKIQVVGDKWGTPCYAQDVAHGILKLLDCKQYGKYHLANHGMCSRFEFAQKIFEYAGIDCAIENVPSDFFPRIAPRPRNESLCNCKLQELNLDPMRNWQEALREYLMGL